MPTFSRLKTWVSNEVLTAADLNAEFNNLLNNMTPAGIDDASATVVDMQAVVDPGGVGSEAQATDLLGEVKRLRYKIKQIIGGAQWYSTPAINLATTIQTASIADDAVTTAKIPNSNVTTAKIANNAVTRAKLEALGHQISSGSGSFTTSSTSYVDVTNLSVSITTSGRPVYIGIIGDGSNLSYVGTIAGGAGDVEWQVQFLQGVNAIYVAQPRSSGSGAYFRLPPSSFWTIDTPAAGTYTYKVRCALSLTGNTLAFNDCKLIAYEL